MAGGDGGGTDPKPSHQDVLVDSGFVVVVLMDLQEQSQGVHP